MRPLIVLTAVLGLSCSADALAADRSFAQIERGKYLVTAGDCVACHTTIGGKPFAGGRPVETPFGTIYSPNITPDQETGIGGWSDDQFYKALHTGIDPAGRHLYPAFPYPNFTKVTRSDSDAMRAYLDTIEPVRKSRPAASLVWPFGYRFLMTAWNQLFFNEGTFRPEAAKNEQWNRGAYLVEGLGHCGACHTPKNLAGGDDTGHRLEGGVLQGWRTSNLTSDPREGLGNWSDDEIVEYLKSGRNSRSGATGLMAEVVSDSTSHMTDEDLQAIAVYLKDQPGHPIASPAKAPAEVLRAGKAIYDDSCSACHQTTGNGVNGLFPALAGNANAQASDPTTLIRILLQGAQITRTDAKQTFSAMPAYGWKLNDKETAAVLSYVRNAWGNAASEVSDKQVGSVRKGLKPHVP